MLHDFDRMRQDALDEQGFGNRTADLPFNALDLLKSDTITRAWVRSGAGEPQTGFIVMAAQEGITTNPPPGADHAATTTAVRQDTPAGPTDAGTGPRGPFTAEQLRDLPGLVQHLGDDSYRNREAATNALRQAGAAALPHILRVLDGNDPQVSLEAQRRCEIILRDIKERGFLNLLDGLSSTDSDVRNAVGRVIGTIATRDLLESASRSFLDMIDRQRQALRGLVLYRSSEEELNRLYSQKVWGKSNVDDQTLRRTLGLAVLHNSEQVPGLCEHLGRNLFGRGAANHTEAARLLERAAQDPNHQHYSLQALASIRLAQGDTQGWLQTAVRYLPTISRLENDGVGHYIPAACDGLLRQTQQMMANPALTAEQRRQAETLRTRTQELRDDYIQRNPPGEGMPGKKK